MTRLGRPLSPYVGSPEIFFSRRLFHFARMRIPFQRTATEQMIYNWGNSPQFQHPTFPPLPFETLSLPPSLGTQGPYGRILGAVPTPAFLHQTTTCPATHARISHNFRLLKLGTSPEEHGTNVLGLNVTCFGFEFRELSLFSFGLRSPYCTFQTTLRAQNYRVQLIQVAVPSLQDSSFLKNCFVPSRSNLVQIEGCDLGWGAIAGRNNQPSKTKALLRFRFTLNGFKGSVCLRNLGSTDVGDSSIFIPTRLQGIRLSLEVGKDNIPKR
ncbi:hypothetical protein C8R43DRAFT_949639 [Mycena crocata]|nr:hypothetical protein C8R43DRAFT_949635 [Mycena crocata]KAJ7155363.1 hypothetical protein C8R43DRAFT_949639 [Mycena crocata]